MATVSGPSGHTTAIDINTRFLTRFPPNVRVIAGDIRTAALEAESFDIVHARYVLIHVPDFKAAFERMLAAVKIGGWLLLEEPDFSAARAISGSEPDTTSVAKVNRAIRQMFSSKGMDYALGVKLPALFQGAALKNLSVEYDAPISQGTSGVAEMMQLSAKTLRARYIATGEASGQDIENYCRFAQCETSWAIYYATVGVLGQK
jgi:hypothetical protein